MNEFRHIFNYIVKMVSHQSLIFEVGELFEEFLNDLTVGMEDDLYRIFCSDLNKIYEAYLGIFTHTTLDEYQQLRFIFDSRAPKKLFIGVLNRIIVNNYYHFIVNNPQFNSAKRCQEDFYEYHIQPLLVHEDTRVQKICTDHQWIYRQVAMYQTKKDPFIEDGIIVVHKRINEQTMDEIVTRILICDKRIQKLFYRSMYNHVMGTCWYYFDKCFRPLKIHETYYHVVVSVDFANKLCKYMEVGDLSSVVSTILERKKEYLIH